MKLIRVDYQEPHAGYMLINVEKIIYIVWSDANKKLNKEAYANVYFTEGRPSVTLNEQQYIQLIRRSGMEEA